VRIPISKNWFGSDELELIQQPLRDGWVVQGKQVKSFESAFTDYTLSPFSISCSSGTAALHIAVIAMGLKPGDSVVVPAFTWVATANVVELQGAVVRFADIELDTFNSSAQQILQSADSRTVGIIPVHLFGLCSDVETMLIDARQKGLWVVEDAACGLGASISGRSAGTFGDLGCFSFHPRKSITTGEGGMLTTHNPDLARICDGLRNHGAVPRSAHNLGNTGHSALLPEYSIPGLNYRLTDMQGALGVAQMRRLRWLLEERKRCATFYSENLATVHWLTLPKESADKVHAWQSYVTLFAPEMPNLQNVQNLHERRNRLMKQLELRGISTRQGTHAPAHLPYFRQKYRIKPDDFPNAYMADRLSLALPLFPGMTEEELAYVCHSIQSFDPS
jgi:perosamine synthetase